ncbi:hypothetical protein C0J52_07189 [Blattella germanica]|nr:hypothetical protein C0J52_07189 [Blattella germanica]
MARMTVASGLLLIQVSRNSVSLVLSIMSWYHGDVYCTMSKPSGFANPGGIPTVGGGGGGMEPGGLKPPPGKCSTHTESSPTSRADEKEEEKEIRILLELKMFKIKIYITRQEIGNIYVHITEHMITLNAFLCSAVIECRNEA